MTQGEEKGTDPLQSSATNSSVQLGCSDTADDLPVNQKRPSMEGKGSKDPLDAAQKVVASPAAPTRKPTRPTRVPISVQLAEEAAAAAMVPERSLQRCEVPEWQTLSLGPFGSGANCEIVRAWYGVPGDAERQMDVTRYLRSMWTDEEGLRVSGYNSLFGDPAPLRLKKLCVEYSLSNVRSWDVSRAQYTEGVGKLGLMPTIFTKVVSNAVGATVATTGYVVGKAVTVAKNSVAAVSGQEPSHSVADAGIFQWSFHAWLTLNGVMPSVTYDPTPKSRLPAEDMRQTPLIVCNHMCYLDGMVLAAIFGAPKIIAMQGTTNTPLLGFFAKEIGVIEVDRSNPDSRAATRDAINKHVEAWKPGDRPLLLFPEGTTSNGDSMLEFKRGAFLSGKPVRPVVLTYTGSWHPANVNYKTTSGGQLVPTGDSEWVEQFMGHLIHSLKVRVLPPYQPSPAEQADPDLYASNVRLTMLDAYGRLKADASGRDEGQWSALKTLASPMEGLWDLLGSNRSRRASSSQQEARQRPSVGPRSGSRPRRSQVGYNGVGVRA